MTVGELKENLNQFDNNVKIKIRNDECSISHSEIKKVFENKAYCTTSKELKKNFIYEKWYYRHFILWN